MVEDKANGRRMPSTTTTVLDGSEADLVDDRDRMEADAKAWGARDARTVEAEGETVVARVAARRAAGRKDIMIEDKLNHVERSMK